MLVLKRKKGQRIVMVNNGALSYVKLLSFREGDSAVISIKTNGNETYKTHQVKLRENLLIHDSITIYIVDIFKFFVKVGIDAPKSVIVDREEIHLKKIKSVN